MTNDEVEIKPFRSNVRRKVLTIIMAKGVWPNGKLIASKVLLNLRF